MKKNSTKKKPMTASAIAGYIILGLIIGFFTLNIFTVGENVLGTFIMLAIFSTVIYSITRLLGNDTPTPITMYPIYTWQDNDGNWMKTFRHGHTDTYSDYHSNGSVTTYTWHK